MPSRASTRTPARNPSFVLCVVALVALAACRGRGAGPDGSTASPRLPEDPAAFVPTGSSAVLLLDVAALRRVEAVRSLALRPGHADDCRSRLLARVDRAAVAFSGAASEFGLAMQGSMTRDDLVSCVHEGAGRTAEVGRDRYRGVLLTTLRTRTPAGIEIARRSSEIVYSPGGVVLLGPPEVVRRMLDRALAGAPGEFERDTPTMAALGRVPAAMHVRFATRLLPDPLAGGDDEADPAFAHVVGIGIGARFENGMASEMRLYCNDFDSPRDVALALRRVPERLARIRELSDLATSLRAATIDRAASSVQVRWRLDEDGLRNVSNSLRAVLEAIAPDAVNEPSGATPVEPSHDGSARDSTASQ